ncbi:antitoxin [Cellulomonas sp. NPDC089187]|uniref:antitoxin n=1 Tax=Cellulomonas sp. NPDC089187 TaxID=3154970 RepID=UPI0034379FA9
MGIGDYVDKAKQALAGHEGKVTDALDKAADAVKSRTSDDTDRKIDSAVDKAKDFLAKQSDGPGSADTPRSDSDRPRPQH